MINVAVGIPVLIVVAVVSAMLGYRAAGRSTARLRGSGSGVVSEHPVTPMVQRLGTGASRESVRVTSVADSSLRPKSVTMTHMELHQLVIHYADTGIVVVDRHRDIILRNKMAEDLALVRDQLLDDRTWKAAEEALRTNTEQHFELTAQAPNITTQRLLLSVRGVCRVVEKNGDRFVVVYAHDDSEGVRMEATRRDFVANVSHELKTPVGAIGLLTEALLESVDDPESVQHFGSRVLAESNRMGNMVNELIALSRLQGAEKLPDLDVVAVDDVVFEAIHRARTAAEAAGIALVVDAPSGLSVQGDATLLVTALSNLISNAIAYSPTDTQVSISRRVRDGFVEVSVTDRGIGIAPEDQERVFERFFRVDKARSRMTGGTGLGLAIVKHVAANHDGSITLWSRPGMGSTFTLRLPECPKPEAHYAPSQKPGSSGPNTHRATPTPHDVRSKEKEVTR